MKKYFTIFILRILNNNGNPPDFKEGILWEKEK